LMPYSRRVLLSRQRRRSVSGVEQHGVYPSLKVAKSPKVGKQLSEML
jgi:hypothetical protein